MHLQLEEDDVMLATHEGWYWFCPVWVAFRDDGLPIVSSKVFEPIFWIANEWQQFLNVLISFVNPEACGFMLKIRKLREPKQIYL